MAEVAFVAARVGNGDKIHVAKVEVKQQDRFGRVQDVYEIEDVRCGVVRVRNFVGHQFHGVVKVFGEKFEQAWDYFMDADDKQKNWDAYYAACAAGAQEFGDNFCVKCAKNGKVVA